MWPFLIVLSLLPIWRYPPYEGGYNLLQLLELTKEPRKHIPREEAIAKAGLAYISRHSEPIADMAVWS